jgi:anthranilate/para-aminobenzoate synthase component I
VRRVAEPPSAEVDLLARARGLRERGHRVALLDSPDSPAARYSHLCRLREPLVDERPSLATEHVCLATFDHGLGLHDIPGRHEPELGFELASFPVAERWTLDHATGEITRTSQARPLDEVPRAEPGPPVEAGPPTFTHDQAAFASMVEQAQAYIEAGHSYQVNLSLRATTDLTGDPSRLYEQLRSMNPSPYQALVLAPEVTLVSASPELLVDVRGRQVTTRPIAGTRPRGETAEQDQALAAELRRDAKERAEHAMLVDLARNDLGRVAAYGTVEVAEDAIVERYSHVMHLVSEVQARLREDEDAWRAFEAIFPCGTISGAPKRRSLEIVDELEPVSRGAYTGSLGLLTPEWSTWNILIRTLVLQAGRAHVQAGAGIVADSVPEREHEESLAKARALLEALGVRSEVSA